MTMFRQILDATRSTRRLLALLPVILFLSGCSRGCIYGYKDELDDSPKASPTGQPPVATPARPPATTTTTTIPPKQVTAPLAMPPPQPGPPPPVSVIQPPTPNIQPFEYSGGVRQPLPPSRTKVEFIPDALKKDIATGVAYFTNSELRQIEIRQTIKLMAEKGEDLSVRILCAMVDEGAGSNLQALEGLGLVSNAMSRTMAAEKIQSKLSDKNPQVAATAARSYARIKGDDGIPEILGFIRSRFQQPDGNELQTTCAAAKAIGGIGSDKAVEALASELSHSVERTWLPDYGSAVVEALGMTGKPIVKEIMQKYSEVLLSKMPPENDPNGRAYYREKISEALKIGALAGEGKAYVPPKPENPWEGSYLDNPMPIPK